MPRSKEEIISEMVDSGLFSDEEIRQSTRQKSSPGILKQSFEALAIPERLSRQGLGMLAKTIPGVEPTGNLARDIALNVPKVAAETLAEAAPGFISRGQILTAGGLKFAKGVAPVIKGAAKGIAKGAEAISGLEYKTPRILSEIAAKPGILFGPGARKVGAKYAEAMNKANIRPSFGRATSPKELLDDALKAADEKTLTPEEALIARQTLDGIKKSIPRYSYHQMRETFDNIAKTITKEADSAFRKAIKSDAIRNIFAQNKLGGSSIAKLTLGSLAGSGIGYAGGGGLGVIPLMAMSPIVQGSLAAGAGIGARGLAQLAAQPRFTSASLAALQEFRKRKGNK